MPKKKASPKAGKTQKPQVARSKRNGVLYILLILIVVGSVAYMSVKTFMSSLFINHKDRVNIVVYGKNATFYSLGVNEANDYIIPFFPDLKVEVPGGYGSYRVGSVGKLVQLEHKPEIYQKTFSLVTSTYIDFYFYPSTDEVYYGTTQLSKTDLPLEMSTLFFNNSNANFFDRIYIAMFLSSHNIDDFKMGSQLSYDTVHDDVVLLQETLTKDTLGLFYQKAYRNEKKTVQVLYGKNYQAAEKIGSIMEGNGIRVSDISVTYAMPTKCTVKEARNEFSTTAKSMANFFHCQLQTAPTGVYDILIELGDRELEWEL